MRLQNFKKIVREAPEELKEEVRLSMDILDRLHDLLQKKMDGKQKMLAEKMGVSEAVVSRWLNGTQNFTIATLARLSAAFGEQIIAVCTANDQQSTFQQVTVPSNKLTKSFAVTDTGSLVEEHAEFKPLTLRKKNNSSTETAV